MYLSVSVSHHSHHGVAKSRLEFARLRRCGTKPNGDFGAACDTVLGGDVAVVALSEGVDDGQSESGTACGACWVGAAESVDGAWAEAGWESGAVVAGSGLAA